VSAAVNIVLNVVLIPRFGLVGCAWATAGAFGANMIVFAYLVHRRLPSSGAWTITATLPTLAGAAYAAWQADHVGALGVSVVTSAVVLFWNRRDALTSVRTLRSSGIFAVAPRFPFQRRVS
jgi:O-antigen/teichoic acid export membrane protein